MNENNPFKNLFLRAPAKLNAEELKEFADNHLVNHLGEDNLGIYIKKNFYNLIKYEAVVITYDKKGDLVTLKTGFIDITRNYRNLMKLVSVSHNPVYIMNKSSIDLPPEQVEQDFFFKITNDCHVLGKSLELNSFTEDEDGAPIYKKEEIDIGSYREVGFFNLKRIIELNPQHAPWKLFGSILHSSGVSDDAKSKDFLYSTNTHIMLVEASNDFFSKKPDPKESELIKNIENFLPATSDIVKDGFLYIKKEL